MLNSPNFALYVAIIGFVSSLIVVLINAAVTLASKKIDAQQKKDEQSYGFKMEYMKRKLSAGENAIGQITALLKTFGYLHQLHLVKLKSYTDDEDLFYHEEIELNRKSVSEKVVSYYNESAFAKNDTYYAYFPKTVISEESINSAVKADKFLDELNLLTYQFNEAATLHLEEPAGENKSNLHKKAYALFEKMIAKMELYIKANEDAQSSAFLYIEHIRQEMKGVTSLYDKLT